MTAGDAEAGTDVLLGRSQTPCALPTRLPAGASSDDLVPAAPAAECTCAMFLVVP